MAQSAQVHTFRGEWDEALALVDALRAGGEDESERTGASVRPLISAGRGEIAESEAWLARPVARSEWHELALHENLGRAVALRAIGRFDEAVSLVAEDAPDVMGTS